MEMKEFSPVSRLKPPLTVADLDAFPEDDGNRYELIDGELFESRAPGIPHQRVLLNLEIALGEYLRSHPIGILVPGAGAIFSDFDAVIPDLVFVRNERWEQVVTGEKFTGPMDLVIEILSPGSANRRRDIVAKRNLYGKYEIEEYWIVDSDTPSIKIFRQSAGALQETVTLAQNDSVTSSILPGFHLIVGTIFKL